MPDYNHDLETSLGCMFAGNIISAVLVGFILCQGFTYYTRYPNDRLFIKVLVAIAIMCEVVHQALISFALYHFTVKRPITLARFIWGNLLPCVPNIIAVVAVQYFFILRIWHFSKQARVLAGALTVMVLLELGLTMFIVAKFLQCDTSEQFFMTRKWMMIPIALAAVIDMIIAVALVIVLHRSRTGIQRTDNIINTLMMFSITTGLVTALWAVGTLVPVAVTGFGLVSMFFYCLLGAIYVVSLLFSLNMRNSILAAGETTISFVGPRAPEPPPIRPFVHSLDSEDRKVDV